MRRHIPLVFCMALISMVALSGCVGQEKTGGPQYKNDVITIEDYYVSNLKPYAGSEATMEFLVQNNGENPMGRVKVDFFSLSGLTIVELKCSGTDPEYSASRQSAGCTFDSTNAAGAIEPFDVRKVTMRLKMPDLELKTPKEFTVSYYVEYDYAGFRVANVPIVDGETVTKASTSFSQSTSSYGPIRLDFELPVRGEHKENGQTVKEYWGVKGQPFEIKMKFTNVATSKLKDASPLLKAGKVRLDVKEMLNPMAGTGCGLCIGGASGCPGTNPKYAYPLKDVKVPAEVSCDFKPLGFETPEAMATMSADFSYTYRYVLSEKLSMQPLG